MQYKYDNIIWLCQTNFTGGLESLLKKQLKEAGLSDAPIRFRCLTQGCLKKKTKTKYTWDQSKYNQFEYQLLGLKPDFIVVQDKAALGFLTQQYISTALTRGAIYKWHGIPVLVVDDIKKVKSTAQGGWIFKQDLSKLKRWITGQQRHQPKFSYTVVENKKQLDEFKSFADESILISTDIETSGIGRNCLITCSGYTCWHKSGKIHTWVVPFVDTTKTDGCYWRNQDDEIYAFKTLKHVHANPVYKLLQNGSYDSAHVIHYHMPYSNYTLDTLHLFHSIWAESLKRLDFISSICLDFYRYWKDEGKEDEKDDKESTKVPQTEEGLKDYWRYNALDCYYTMMDAVYLVQIHSLPQMEWAKNNYIKEFRQQTGPCLAGSLRGAKWNKKLQQHFNEKLNKESYDALQDLHIMIQDFDFNPNSPPQVQKLIYDALNADEIPRQKRSTNEIVLKLVQTQHPLFKRIIKQIWNVKKPANNASKYGELTLLNNRFMYKISAAGTETGRQATRKSDFWVGNNVQNVPDPMRVLFEPDEGYVLFDFDYSQSDAYFTAFESEDPNYIKTMLSPEDTHCIHAAHFFKIPFEKLVEGKKNHADWCVHKVTGVRSVTKRVVYGANYLMTAYTLFLTMGQDAVIAAAKHLGYSDAASWNHKQLIFLCQKFLDAYFEFYPILPAWLEEEITKAVANSNLVKCYGGMTRLFFSNLRNDAGAQRELAAFFGQGGPAGNINGFLDDFYYTDGKFQSSNYEDSDSIHDTDDIMFLFQVHDSVVGQVRIDKLHLLKNLKRKMERECEIHGRKFIVPVEGQVGFGWGKRMIDWHPDITVKEIQAHENKWWDKFNKENRV